MGQTKKKTKKTPSFTLTLKPGKELKNFRIKLDDYCHLTDKHTADIIGINNRISALEAAGAVE